MNLWSFNCKPQYLALTLLWRSLLSTLYLPKQMKYNIRKPLWRTDTINSLAEQHTLLLMMMMMMLGACGCECVPVCLSNRTHWLGWREMNVRWDDHPIHLDTFCYKAKMSSFLRRPNHRRQSLRNIASISHEHWKEEEEEEKNNILALSHAFSDEFFPSFSLSHSLTHFIYY